MTAQAKLGAVLDRLAAGTGALRVRSGDQRRAQYNGHARDERLEEAVTKFEAAADELWTALGLR